MEKEKLSNDLKGLVGENGLSERTWNDYVDNSVIPFVPSDETQIDDYLAKHAVSLKSLNGQLNNEVASRVNEFKKTYKPEHPIQNQPEKPQPKNQESNEKPEWAKSLEDKLNKFELEKTTETKAAQQKQRLSEVTSKIKEQGADNETVLKLTLSSINLEEDLSTDECVRKVKQAYDKNYSEIYGEGYTPAYGVGGATANKKAVQEAYKKHLEETGRIKTQTKN